jgi:hypothetical protein
MKNLIFLFAVVFSLNVTADDLQLPSQPYQLLQSRFPEGSWKGQGTEEECFVVVKHDQHITDHVVTMPAFELSIFSKDYQSKVSYRLNNGMIIGGRGDCPTIRTYNLQEIFIVNGANRAPCFANYNRSNHGGLQVIAEFREKIYRVLNENGNVIKECRVIEKN